MQTQLLIEQNRPDFDEQIEAFVQANREYSLGGKIMTVGIQHNGQIYRHIFCEGLPEYLACVGFLLEELELTDLLDGKPAQNGVDSLFVKQP